MKAVKSNVPPALPPIQCAVGGKPPAKGPVTFTVGEIQKLVCQTAGTSIKAGTSVEFANADKEHPYVVKFIGTPQVTNTEIVGEFTSYKTGSHDVSQIYVKVGSQEYQASLQRFLVKSVLPAEAPQPLPQQGEQKQEIPKPTPVQSYGPQKVLAPWWWWAIWIFLFLVLAFFGIREFLAYKTRKKQQVERAAAETPLTPAQKFQQRLRKLESHGYHQQGQYKSFALELTQILKNSISEVFAFNAEDMTSEELLLTLQRRQRAFYDRGGRSLQNIFEELDRIKFAKIETTPERCLTLLDETLQLGRSLFGGQI